MTNLYRLIIFNVLPDNAGVYRCIGQELEGKYIHFISITEVEVKGKLS